jgi:hypothetical protein
MIILRFIDDATREDMELRINDHSVSFEIHHVGQGRWLLLVDLDRPLLADDGFVTLDFQIRATHSFADLGYDKHDFLKRGFALEKFEVAVVSTHVAEK